MYVWRMIVLLCRLFLVCKSEDVCLAKETTMHELVSLGGVWISSSDLMFDFDAMLYGDND